MSVAFGYTEVKNGEIVDLPVASIRTDGETQSRSELSTDAIEYYLELMLEGVEFPPVRAYFDGEHYWLTDGFHRVIAAQRAHRETIRAEIVRGSLEDARWDSYSANALHGLPRTASDVRRVVELAFSHERATHFSNREIARHLHLSEKTIRRLRGTSSSAGAADERIAVRNGREYKIRTANIGRARKKTIRDGDNGDTGIRANLERRLAADLLIMDREASPEARRILIIFRNWTQRAPNPLSTLDALEKVISELKASRFVMRQA